MAASYVSTKAFVNLDPSVDSAVLAVSAGSTHAIVVHVAVASQDVTVASVTDDNNNNVYSSVSALANDEVDYATGRYSANPVKDNFIDGECWFVKSGGTVTKVTVTLSNGARFAVEALVYVCGGGIGNSIAGTAIASGAPSVSLTTAVASTSIVSAGFSTVKGLNQGAGAGAGIMAEVAGAPEGGAGLSGVAVTVEDKLAAGSGPTAVALAPVSTESVSISISSGSPQAGTQPVPASYAICAVEIKA